MADCTKEITVNGRVIPITAGKYTEVMELLEPFKNGSRPVKTREEIEADLKAVIAADKVAAKQIASDEKKAAIELKKTEAAKVKADEKAKADKLKEIEAKRKAEEALAQKNAKEEADIKAAAEKEAERKAKAKDGTTDN